jgi:hypothetical protein
MIRKKIELACAVAFMMVLESGCANVNYIGNTLEKTTSVETYFSEEAITSDYSVIGYAVGLGIMASGDKVHAKLLKTAEIKGADAILITGIGKAELLITVGIAIGESQIFASFLKYK